MTITYFERQTMNHCEAEAPCENQVMEQLLDDAKGIVCGDRQDAYGAASTNHTRTAKMFSVFLGIPITPRQVAYLNILQKCAREVNASRRDNDLDIAGYAANAAACAAVETCR